MITRNLISAAALVLVAVVAAWLVIPALGTWQP